MRFIQQLFSKEENKNRKKEACVGRIDPGARAILRYLWSGYHAVYSATI